MLDTSIGPYHIEQEIGSGGMGTVYRAVVERPVAGMEPGTRVALKVVHPHLLSKQGFFKRFLREADLGRRVDHANVVATCDVDAAEVDGQVVHFLVMEYVEGQTLRDLLYELGRVPEVLLREIAIQVADGLEAIHAAGIVHRDLKPENVLVTDDHQVRIMDLGVAHLVESTAHLTGRGEFLGSLFYAAPEQLSSQTVGTAADLYSLGVLLYELATGRNPFTRPDPGAVIRAHLEEAPPPLLPRHADLSGFFAALVHTLLAKAPEARFASAGALGAVLKEGEASTWWKDGVRHPSRAMQERIPVRIRVQRETGLHGRREVLAELERAWERAREGEGSTILVEGEAGIGKTRLLAELVDRVGPDGAHVLYGGYAPAGGIGGISEGVVEHFGGTDLAESLTPYLGVTPDLVPAFAAMLKHEPPPAGAQRVEGDALHALTVHLLRGMAAERPVVWVVDDLHNARSDSRGVVLSMARAVPGHAVLLVVTTRPELPEDELAHFTRLEGLQRLGLGRLSPREVMELLYEATGSNSIAERLGGVIAHKSDGVPLFVFEILHTLRERGVLREEGGGLVIDSESIDRIEVPSAVRDLLAGRLGDLAQDERELLDVGAVEGFEFDAALVAAVLERRPIHVLQTLAAIERRSGVVRAEGLRYRFDHHQIQQVLYEMLPEALRRAYHGELAAAYSRRAGLPEEVTEAAGEDAVFLATHHIRGPAPEHAIPLLDAALDHLEVSWCHQDAIDLTNQALRLGAVVPLDRQVDLWLRWAGRARALGRHEEERTAVGRALENAEALEDGPRLARALTQWGALLARDGKSPEARAALEQARGTAHAAADSPVEAATLLELGNIDMLQGRHEEAREEFEKSLALAREGGDRRAEARAIGCIGSVLRGQGRLEEACTHHERHRAVARETQDRPGEMAASGNLANTLTYMGKDERADEAYGHALVIAREIGNRPGEATLLGNRAGVLFTRGRYADALVNFVRALPLAREIDNRFGQANVLVNLARLWLWLGRHDRCEAHLGQADALVREMEARRLEAHVWEVRASLDQHRGRHEDALRAAGEARRLFEQVGNPIGMASAYARSGFVELALGRTEDAKRHLNRAQVLSQKARAHVGAALVACVAAGLCENGVEEAARRADATADAMGLLDRVLAYGYLHAHSGRPNHLEAAWSALETLIQNAPPEHRETMRTQVPPFLRVITAWEARGA